MLVPQNLTFKAKACAASRANKIELLILISDIMVTSSLKNIQWNFCGIHGMS